MKNIIDNTALWDAPDISVIQDKQFSIPEFPVNVFSDAWKQWIIDSAESKNCPPDFVGVSLITSVAGLLGNSRRARPWNGWTEPTILWGALIGLPSIKKSPALDCILDHIYSIEKKLAVDYKKTLMKYEKEKAIAHANLEKWNIALKAAMGKNAIPPDKPLNAVIPNLPPRPRLLISDITIEKAGELLSYNPKGLMLQRDELAGLIFNFERRGGSDREFYLESYGGRPYSVDRKSHPEPIIIPSLSISIIGGMQPDKMVKIFSDGMDDGFAARFLYSWPNARPFKRPVNIPDDNMIKETINKISSLNIEIDNCNIEPRILPFTEKASLLMEQWYQGQVQRESEVSGIMISHIGKMPGMVVRISTVFTYLEWAISNRSLEPTEIDENAVFKAIQLIDGYFLPMARRCFGDAALPTKQRNATILAKWLLSEIRHNINLLTIFTTAGAPKIKDKEQLQEAAYYLESHNWLKFIGGRDGDKGGRQRQDFEVNPLIYEIELA